MKDNYLKVISKTSIGGMIPEKNYYVTEATAKILVKSKRAVYYDAKLQEEYEKTIQIENKIESEPHNDTDEVIQNEKTIEDETIVEDTDEVDTDESLIDTEPETIELPKKKTYNRKKKK